MTRNKEKYQVADREEITRMMDEAVTWTKHIIITHIIYIDKKYFGES